ncbi:MAG: hypothetical protein ACP5QO_16450, partial [Clostridia bacterium]
SCAPTAPPGHYTVTMEAGTTTETQSFRLLAPPNVDIPQAHYDEQFKLLVRIRDDVSRIHEAYNRVAKVRAEVAAWEPRVVGHEHEESLKESLARIRERADEARDRLIQWRLDNFQDSINFPPQLNAKVAHIFQVVASADARPTSQSYTALEALEAQVDTEVKRVDSLMAEEVAEFNRRAREANLTPIGV